MTNRVRFTRFPVAQLLAAAALTAMAAGAQAQSSVQVYGLIDMSAGQFQAAGKAKDKAVQSGNMSTSYFGFKGTEDLGGGLKANFATEGFLRADSGSSGRFNGDAFWARNAYVGLSGDFGGLTLGRNTTSLFVSTLIFNAFGDSFGFSPTIRHYFTSGTVTGDTGWNQSISYSTPNMGGLSAQLQVTGNDGASTGRKTGGNVLYFAGAFAGTVAYQKVKAGTTNGSTTSHVGASYDLGGAKLYGQYGKVKNDTTNVGYKLAEVGVAVPVGAGKVLAEYGQLKPDTGAKRTTITAGYDYGLSKRTDVYGVVMSDKLTGTNTGSTYAVGVRHKF
jgi:predicted porin